MSLMNDMVDIRQAYRVNEIDNLAWVRSSQNITDHFTRHFGNNTPMNTIRAGHLDFFIEQWVFNESIK